MGTNYYHYQTPLNYCDCCGRFDSQDEPLHIGKSSGGWVFSLHIIPELGLHDLEDWTARFQTGEIRDEYGTQIEPGLMLKTITERTWTKRDWESEWWSVPGFYSYQSESDFHDKNHSERGPNGLLRHRIGPHCVKHGAGTWDCMPGAFA